MYKETHNLSSMVSIHDICGMHAQALVACMSAVDVCMLLVCLGVCHEHKHMSDTKAHPSLKGVHAWSMGHMLGIDACMQSMPRGLLA